MSAPEYHHSHLKRLKTLSTLSIVLERLTQAGWRLVCWVAFFVALWLFEIPSSFGQISSVLTLLLALFGVAYFIRTDLLKFTWPREDEVLRGIERYSSVPHRPLTGLRDKPVDGDQSGALWRREKTRRNRLLIALRPYTPQAFVARQDPRALRLGALLLFFCAVIVAGTGWKARLYNGLFPVQISASEAEKTSRVSLWITPPEYTQLPRILPNTESDEALRIPQGSVIKVIVQSGLAHIFGAPSLLIDETEYPLINSEDDAYTLEQEILPGSTLSLKTGPFHTLRWDYDYIHDTRPEVSVNAEPKPLQNGQIQFAVDLKDDFGVQTLDMRMTLDPAVEDAPAGWPAQEERSVMSPAGQAFQISPVYDLASHPWAGLPVVFTFTAHDHLDQIAQSQPVHTILPERQFTHPVARKLIEVRKQLAWNPTAPYAEPMSVIEATSLFPGQYGNDTRIFLALRVATLRLFHNAPSVENSQSVMALLWDIALRLEDGNLSLAARDLRDIQKQLEQALNDPNVSNEEVSFLMQKLREAMAEYMQAMAREWQKRMQNGEQPPGIPPELMNNMVNMNDLASLLDKMESDMLSGDRNAAQDMLSKLQRLLDMTNPSMNTAMPQDMQMMMEGLGELKDLIEEQEDLLSKTQEQAEMFEMLKGLGVDARDEPPPFINTAPSQATQEEIRERLAELIAKAQSAMGGQSPENMEKAEQAMSGSSESLGGNRPDLSIPLQEEAIALLKEAQQQMAQQLAQRMQQMTGFSIGGMPSQFDPLGRPYGNNEGPNGQSMGSQVKIPSESEQKRVQDILNELRRRAGERNRPREELEYYRRLLKRF